MLRRMLVFQDELQKNQKARQLALELLREDNVWKISDIIDGLDGDMARRALKLYVFSRPRFLKEPRRPEGDTAGRGGEEA